MLLVPAPLILLLIAGVLAHEHHSTTTNTETAAVPEHYTGSLNEEEHLLQHLQGKIDPKKVLLQGERMFYFFDHYDKNRDLVLDGIEMYKSIAHDHNDPNRVLPEEQVERLVDEALRTDDLDGDGYIDWNEFIYAEKQRLIQQGKKVDF